MIQGFTQTYKVDYFNTFNPVIKNVTVKTILRLALSNGWPSRQLDVNNTFLNDTFDEDVYMQQSEGFIDPHRHHYMCKLANALYGLK